MPNRVYRHLRVARAVGLILGACTLTHCASVRSGEAPLPTPAVRYAGPTYAFINGQWLRDSAFEPRTFYAVNGVLQSVRPPQLDSTIDLAGGYVIPPFADAHTHNLDGPRGIEAVVDAYLGEGTFYVQVLTNRASNANQVRARFNRPCTLDVLYANGGITGMLSHPFLAYEPRALGIFQFDQWRARAAEIWSSRRGEKDVYWFVDNVADLERQWPEILAGGPDLVKIFLLDASETAPQPPRDSTLQSGHGLKPSLVAPIVRRAHAAALRVAAHVETASDFEIAVDAGVDLFAHLPGYGAGIDRPASVWLISETAARKAGARGVAVVPTTSWMYLLQGSADSAAVVARRFEIVRQNLRTLMAHGVHIVMGSDRFGLTTTIERPVMQQLQLWDTPALLRMWTETTAHSMFPHRPVGRLDDGYEASFLVLPRNPLVDLTAIETIRMRVKQGCVLADPPPPAR